MADGVAGEAVSAILRRAGVGAILLSELPPGASADALIALAQATIASL